MSFKLRVCLYLALALALGVWYLSVRGDDRYCWLVFGPKGDTRVLLRVAGEELFLDRDGDGRFNGPLTVQAQTIRWQLPPELALARGDEPTDLRAIIGTLDPATECWTTVLVHGTNNQSNFSANVHPVVDVEYPPKVAGARPMQVRYALKEFC